MARAVTYGSVPTREELQRQRGDCTGANLLLPPMPKGEDAYLRLEVLQWQEQRIASDAEDMVNLTYDNDHNKVGFAKIGRLRLTKPGVIANDAIIKPRIKATHEVVAKIFHPVSIPNEIATPPKSETDEEIAARKEYLKQADVIIAQHCPSTNT